MWKLLAAASLLYIVVARLLRFRILRANNRAIAPGAPLSTLTIADAQKIVLRISGQDFPTVFKGALQFALFRTYGIPSIADLLLDTSLLSEYSTASKRYADTVALCAEMLVRDVGTKPWIEGVARLNCIHAKYQVSGRISNDDMLYTLSLFVCEPVRFINRYEWRQLSDIEVCAVGILWKTIGDGMQIDMSPLKSDKWRDGLHWFNELRQWSQEYEARCMLQSPATVKLADQVVGILLWNTPQRFRGFGRSVIAAVMDDRLRKAMAFKEPSQKFVERVELAISVRKVLMLFAPTRPWIFRYHNTTMTRTEHGTYYMREYDSLPYYVKPDIWNRWSPGALIHRLRGLPVPGDDGDKYYPHGYRTVDLGPDHGKKGQEAMEIKVAPFGQRRCPMAFT